MPGPYLCIVSLLTPGETDYDTASHPRKTTTYILDVVSITSHTHGRRKSIGEKKQRKEKKRKERKEERKKRETKKNEKGKERKEKDKKSKKGQDKTAVPDTRYLVHQVLPHQGLL